MRHLVFMLLLFLNEGIVSMDNKEVNFDQNVEIYPMPMFCVLMVSDVEKSITDYKALGFTSIFDVKDSASGDINFAHLRRKKYQDILLKKDTSFVVKNDCSAKIVMQSFCDIDELTRNAQSYNVRVVKKPHNTLWNTREVTFKDRDGYTITFSDIVSTTKSMNDVVAQI